VPYNLYFSHTWNYKDAYKELNDLLSAKGDFDFISSFISADHSIHRTDNERKLYETIKNKIKFCDAVILLCGVYPVYSRWINKELIACKEELNKPLIAVQRFGAGPVSFIVKEHADLIVDWNADAIIAAVKSFHKD
jgi:hypothetical protein